MPIGITLILIACKKLLFDEREFIVLFCCWCHSIQKNMLFLVIVANLCYCKCVSIKMKVKEML